MKIEINEKGSRAFYNETVNVMSQFKALSRNPAAKLRDNLGAMKRYSIICGALLVMLAVMCITARRAGAIQVAAMVLMVANIVMSLMVYRTMSSTAEKMMADQKPRVLTLDETGASLTGEGTVDVSIPWSWMAFVRSFNDATCFIPESEGGIIISVEKRYKQQIEDYIRDNGVKVRVLG